MVTQTKSVLTNLELLQLLEERHVQKWKVGSSAGGEGEGGRDLSIQIIQVKPYRHNLNKRLYFITWSTVYQQSQKNKTGGNKKLNYSTITQTHTYISKEPNKNKQH
jgi:hypothetical protein